MNKHRYLREIVHFIGEDHVTAHEVYIYLKKQYPKIGQATIYRNLQELVESGDLMKTKGITETILYEKHKPPHAHIVCKGSGKIFDVSLTNIDVAQLDLPEGFTPDVIHMLIEGHFDNETCRGKVTTKL